MMYVCPHYVDPFVELFFETKEEAEVYARAYKKVTGKEIEIEERDEDVDV